MQPSKIFRLYDGGVRQLRLQGGQNLDALDRVDAEITVEAHIEFEHLDGVAGFVGDDFEQRCLRGEIIGQWKVRRDR